MPAPKRRKRRPKDQTIFWVLAVVFLAIITAGTLQLAITGSFESATSVTLQKIINTIYPRVNELESQEYLDRVMAATGVGEEVSFGVFENKVITVPDESLAEKLDSSVLAASATAADGSEKWVEVDLSDQTLKAWEGTRVVYEIRTSTGRPGYETVTGEFRVWRKVTSQRYIGGSKARGDYYNLPNVPYSLFFHQGYAIHGAYWHNDFGIRRRSSGCINLSPTDAEKIYNWAGPNLPDGVRALNATPENPGIRVVVHQ